MQLKSAQNNPIPPYDGLAKFFGLLRDCSLHAEHPIRKSITFGVEESLSFSRLISMLKAPLDERERAGLFGNPWSMASLGASEVRNAKVLAWFLNPRGGHGSGDLVLIEILEKIRKSFLGDFPLSRSTHCYVHVEECPDGSNFNRVDIQIDDQERFFVIVEVKIGAGEQANQLERYCEIAESRACGRPWAVVFLTNDGRPPITAGKHIGKIVPLAWSSLGSLLRRIARRTSSGVPRFLLTSFANHVTTFVEQ